jgi:hypothetical protein
VRHCVENIAFFLWQINDYQDWLAISMAKTGFEEVGSRVDQKPDFEEFEETSGKQKWR